MCILQRWLYNCYRTGRAIELHPADHKENISCPEYEVVSSNNISTIQMEDNPAYSVGNQGNAKDAVKMEDNPAYKVANFSKP